MEKLEWFYYEENILFLVVWLIDYVNLNFCNDYLVNLLNLSSDERY